MTQTKFSFIFEGFRYVGRIPVRQAA